MEQGSPARTVVIVTDANVLINLCHARQLQLLGAIPGFDFRVPQEVVNELTDSRQREFVEASVNARHLLIETLDQLESLTVFAELRQIMGRGEAACLALAETMGWAIASDEKKRFRREALQRVGPTRLYRTEDLLVRGIHAGILSVDAADECIRLLAENRYRMSFHSFRELL